MEQGTLVITSGILILVPVPTAWNLKCLLGISNLLKKLAVEKINL